MVLALREGDELVIRAASGEVDRSQLGLAIPLEGSLSGHVLRSGRAQRLSDSTPGISARVARRRSARTPSSSSRCASAARGSACWPRWTASRRARVQRRGRAADDGVRDQRGDGGRDRARRRRRGPAAQPGGGRARAQPVGARAARPDAAGPRRAEATALRRPQGRGARAGRRGSSSRRSSTCSSASTRCAA